VLNDLDDFLAICVENAGAFSHLGGKGYVSSSFAAGDLYCPGCGDLRRMTIRPLSPLRSTYTMGLNLADKSREGIASQLAPAVLSLACLQDGTRFTAVLFKGPEDYELAIFAMVRGGLSTPHTPTPVAYYLDQAQRAQSAAANSAALAMYRAALEAILYEQGYTMKMLGPKLGALEMAIKESTAPKWAIDLNTEFLSVINGLAIEAIHPGETDVQKQEILDRELLIQLEVTMTELLRIVYENEHETNARLKALKSARAAFKADAVPREEP
jgi:hypothetical protein